MGLTRGQLRVERPGLSPEEPIVCRCRHSSWLSAHYPCKGSWTSAAECPVDGWLCTSGSPGEPSSLLPTHPPRYQHLSAAYNPITAETQRERQKGLTRQVFEQDTSGDERSSPEDSVREPWQGSLLGVGGGGVHGLPEASALNPL